MTSNASNLLETIINLKEDSREVKRLPRHAECLKLPEDDGGESWCFCVPKHFNEALDISLTQRVQEDGTTKLVWTQGSCFSFKAGDVLYDSLKAYQNWQSQGVHFRYCVQIDSAIETTPATKDRPRSPGNVNFTLFEPQHKRTLQQTGTYTMTQDEFVKFLITGKSTVLNLND